MWPESSEQPKPLRTGLTTGACATACCVAAAHQLFEGTPIAEASITLPKGKIVDMAICESGGDAQAAFASTIKDAGDDPDVTHGAKVRVDLAKQSHPGVEFKAGYGVGTVTRDGLLIPVGEPAINPVPRQMMRMHLEAIAKHHGFHQGFSVTVSVADGEQLAKKTMNPKLGIHGGLSILGTTGIVRPFSCSAYIASIHQAVDVANANGIAHIAATTGNSSEDYAKARFGLSDMALVEMGDFVGALLKHLRKQPIKQVTLCGGFGKLSKLAQGHMDLHSNASSIDFDFLADLAQSNGADGTLIKTMLTANTSVQALKYCQANGIELGNAICQKAYHAAKQTIRHDLLLNVIAINRQGACVGQFGDHL
ncbi:MAG: cobalt-precorrin-5B (C(1))-methyltransferase [Cellvibrionales bacterium]|nr:cobalt-precorrin-5B (C(1))-methyltransferase [Cellvibrionales bacterium]